MNTIKITGDFTTENALLWKEKLNESAIKEEALSVDLNDVTVSDIVGVNALITTHKILADKNGQLNVSLKKGSSIYEMLHLTKFLTIFNVTLA